MRSYLTPPKATRAQPRRARTTPMAHARRMGRGFTLIELLVVVAIIALLLAMAIPTFSKVRENARRVSTQARLTDLNSAIESFYQDNQRYPGQMPAERQRMMDDNSPSNSDYTATQLMMVALFDLHYASAPSGKSALMQDPAGWTLDLSEFTTIPNTYTSLNEADRNGYEGVELTPMDDYTERMPILYFPSRRGSANKSAVYNVYNNYVYYESTSGLNQAFNDQMVNPRSGGNPEEVEYGNNASDWKDSYYRPDSFLLIAAGSDRKFFTEDDIVNFNK